MQDRNDDANEHRHKNDCLASGAAPNNDERTERDLRKGIQHYNIRLQHASEEIAPPKREGYHASEYDGDHKADECFRERYADVIKEHSLFVQIADRYCDARGGAHDERIDPSERRDKLPKS